VGDYNGDGRLGPFAEWCAGDATLFTRNSDGPRGREDLLCLETGGALKVQMSNLPRRDPDGFYSDEIWHRSFNDGNSAHYMLGT
jgi:hypothetical protein